MNVLDTSPNNPLARLMLQRKLQKQQLENQAAQTAQSAPKKPVAKAWVSPEAQAAQAQADSAGSVADQLLAPHQGQMVSGYYVAPETGQRLAGILTGAYLKYREGKQSEAADQKAAQDRALEAQAEQEFQQTKLGQSREIPATQPTASLSAGEGATQIVNGNRTPAQAVTPPNPYQAALTALRNPSPYVQQLGRDELERQEKLKATQQAALYDLGQTGAVTIPSMIAAQQGGDISVLQAPAQFEEVNGQIFRKNPDGTLVLVEDARTTAKGKLQQVGTDYKGRPILGNVDELGNISFPPAGQTINVDTGDKLKYKAGETAIESWKEELKKSKEATQASMTELRTIDNVLRFNEAAFTGTGANLTKAVAKFAQIFDPTFKATEVASAELLNSAVGDIIRARAPSFGTGSGFSDADRKFLQETTMQSLASSRLAREYLYRMMKADAMNQWLKHASLVREAGRDPLFKDTRLTAYDMPPMTMKFKADEIEQYNDPATGTTMWRALPPAGFSLPSESQKPRLNVPQQATPTNTRPAPIRWSD